MSKVPSASTESAQFLHRLQESIILSPSLRETVWYRVKYCLKWLINQYNKPRKHLTGYGMQPYGHPSTLVAGLGFDSPLIQYFGLYQVVFLREGEGKEQCPDDPHLHLLQVQQALAMPS